MTALRKIEQILTRGVNAVLVALFAVMLSLAVVQVGLRYFFKTGLLWGDVAARNLVLWVGFLGAVIAARDSKHFHIDIISRLLPERWNGWLQRISALFAAVICYLLGRASVDYLGVEAGTKTFLNLPVPVTEVIIPAGFFLMMIQFVLRAIIGTPPPSGPPGAEGMQESASR